LRQYLVAFSPPHSHFAAHSELLGPVLQIMRPVISTHLIRQADVKRREAAIGAVTPIERFASG